MKRTTRLASAAGLVLLLAACGEPPAELERPKSYDRAGLSFAYPANWEVTGDSRTGAVRMLFVESPGNAIVVVQLQPPDTAPALTEFGRTFARSAADGTPVGVVGASTFAEPEEEDGWEVLRERFTISLMGESVPHTRVFRRRVMDGRVCFLVSQVADEDRARVRRGFEEVVRSLRYEAP